MYSVPSQFEVSAKNYKKQLPVSSYLVCLLPQDRFCQILYWGLEIKCHQFKFDQMWMKITDNLHEYLRTFTTNISPFMRSYRNTVSDPNII